MAWVDGRRLTRAYSHDNPAPVRVSKHGTHWLTTCRCGFTWRTIHHRLALLFAGGHEHASAA